MRDRRNIFSSSRYGISEYAFQQAIQLFESVDEIEGGKEIEELMI